MRAFAILLGLMGGAAFLVEEAWSTTIHVPGDYSTIYAALDAASSGDIVEVAPGTYDQFDTRPLWAGDNVSSVGFLKDGVFLKSSGGAAVTTLRMDTSTARPAVLFGGKGEMHVEGFTLTGSLAELTAISIQPPNNETGSLNLTDCVIRDFGMGVPSTHESAMNAYMADVHIQDCSVENIDSPAAVALFCYGGHAIVVEDSSVKNCSGGGLYFEPWSGLDESLVVRRSYFENNGSAMGSGITASGPSLVVEDSWVAGGIQATFSISQYETVLLRELGFMQLRIQESSPETLSTVDLTRSFSSAFLQARSLGEEHLFLHHRWSSC
jgi:hypothetical protein